MKKIYYAIVCLSLMIAGTTMLSSCDDDTMDSIDLSGEWEGDMGMYIIDVDGRKYTALNTWITFHPDKKWATHGYGEEIDYFPTPCSIYCQNLFFRWEISNGVLYLDFLDDNPIHSLNLRIYDYQFNDARTTLDFSINNKYLCHLNKLKDDPINDTWWYWWDHDRNIMENNKDYYHYMTWAEYNLMTKGREGKVETSSNAIEIKPETMTIGRDFSKFEQVNP